MKYIIAVILLFATSCFAAEGDWHLQVHGFGTKHFSARNDGRWEENNIGLGVRYEMSNKMSAQIGRYKNSNSIDNTSFYTTYGVVDYTPFAVGKISVGAFGGIASGYDEYETRYVNGQKTLVITKEQIIPVAGLLARWQGDIFNLTTRFAPKVNDTGSAVLSLEIGIKF